MGTMPWVAMGFTTLYLQLLGFSDIKAATLVALFGLGCALGSFGGGYIGTPLCSWDRFHAVLDRHGGRLLASLRTCQDLAESFYAC